MTQRRLLLGLLFGLLLVAGCAGAGVATRHDAGDEPGARPWPWEARLQLFATFELVDAYAAEQPAARTTVRVSGLVTMPFVRAYFLEWEGNPNGPRTLTVWHTRVTLGELPVLRGDARGTDEIVCFSEDFSVPTGCDDVCDADLCLSAAHGIVRVRGLYAPGRGLFEAPALR